MKKFNTSPYHTQTDGMIERFNRTLLDMIAKYSVRYGPEWDQYLPYLLFVYRTRVHESSGYTPFSLLYGREARLPSETALTSPRILAQVDIDDYKIALLDGMSTEWDMAKSKVNQAQDRYKAQYDNRASEFRYKEDRVFVQVPYEAGSGFWKISRPFHGPYRVTAVTDTGLQVVPVDDGSRTPMNVHLCRVRPCYEELPDVSWTGLHKKKAKPNQSERGQQRTETDHPYGVRFRDRSSTRAF